MGRRAAVFGFDAVREQHRRSGRGADHDHRHAAVGGERRQCDQLQLLGGDVWNSSARRIRTLPTTETASRLRADVRVLCLLLRPTLPTQISPLRTSRSLTRPAAARRELSIAMRGCRLWRPNYGAQPHFYDMDNEMDIWGGTHRDVHPSPVTYEEIRDTYISEARMMPTWDPAAVRFGPVSCCWWFYWNSEPQATTIRPLMRAWIFCPGGSMKSPSKTSVTVCARLMSSTSMHIQADPAAPPPRTRRLRCDYPGTSGIRTT